MKRIISAWLLAVLLIMPAAAESVIQINGELAPMTQEETLWMVQEVSDAYFQDEAIAAELEAEIRQEVIPLVYEDMDDEELEALPKERVVYTLTHNGRSMRFQMEIKGNPDENGFPLYLTLHGGGGGPAEENDDEWDTMFYYYRGAVENGIYIAIRGITDTWDLHFRPESYPLYDRLIQAMIHLYHADPNRVYLLGFSAGGDGVYQIAPRMADRFAAVNMSSGHPNGVSLRNLANLPISIQVGVRDYYSESALRCVRAAEFEKVLSDWHDLHHYGYEHQVLVRVPAGHNYDDHTYIGPVEEGSEASESEPLADVLADPTAYADPEIVMPLLHRFQQAFQAASGIDFISQMSYVSETMFPEFDSEIRTILEDEFHLTTKKVNGSAVYYVNQFTRNPAPALVEWDLGTRAATRDVNSFYWLRAEQSVTQGMILAMNLGDNHLSIAPQELNGDFSILVNPRMLDVSKPIRISTPEGEFTVQVNPSMETLQNSIIETGDPSLAWVAEIPYSQLDSSTAR